MKTCGINWIELNENKVLKTMHKKIVTIDFHNFHFLKDLKCLQNYTIIYIVQTFT
jgi:hypothetical protein